MTTKNQWDDMSPEEREAAVRTLMAAGGSNTSVAKELGTTDGAIAGLRRRKGIPSINEPPSMGKPKQEQGLAPAPTFGQPEPPRYKMAATEATQCHAHDEEGRRCGYERAPNSVYCILPKHQALQKKPARR